MKSGRKLETLLYGITVRNLYFEPSSVTDGQMNRPNGLYNRTLTSIGGALKRQGQLR